MAELVDALVSNTSGSDAVPVRSRLRVLKKSESESESEHSRLLLSVSWLAVSYLNVKIFLFGLPIKRIGLSVSMIWLLILFICLYTPSENLLFAK